MLKKLFVVAMPIGGAAGFGWQMFADRAPQPDDGVEAPAAEPRGPHGSPDFVKLPTITIPTFRDNEVAGRITAEFTVETNGGRNVRRIEDNIRILQDAFTREMYALAEAESIGRLTIDHGVLKTHLRAVGSRLLGDDVVDDILIRTFVRSGK